MLPFWSLESISKIRYQKEEVYWLVLLYKLLLGANIYFMLLIFTRSTVLVQQFTPSIVDMTYTLLKDAFFWVKLSIIDSLYFKYNYNFTQL